MNRLGLRSEVGRECNVDSQTDDKVEAIERGHSPCDVGGWIRQQPHEASSHDPEILRAALIREAAERRRAECLAKIQTDVVQLALDLLVREPDIKGFFGVFQKTL